MGRQDYYSALFVLFDHFPEASASGSVHTGSRLIEHDDFCIADQGYSHGELSALTTGQSVGKLVLVLNQFDLVQHSVNFLLAHKIGNPLKRGVQF